MPTTTSLTTLLSLLLCQLSTNPVVVVVCFLKKQLSEKCFLYIQTRVVTEVSLPTGDNGGDVCGKCGDNDDGDNNSNTSA
jgi:hypothetical protein